MSKIFQFSFIIPLIIAAQGAWGEDASPIEIDWSSLKIRTSGYSGPIAPGANLKTAEHAAWQDGFKKIENYYQASKLPLSNEAPLPEVVRKHTHSTNTIYYSDGSVRVQFENHFSQAFPVASLGLSDAAPASGAKNSGLIIRLQSAREPSALYQVITSNGLVLFSSKDVSKEAYAKNLMGRWVSAKALPKLSDFVGSNPAEIKALPGGTNLVVDENEWSTLVDGNRGLLEAAKIVIVTP